MKNQIVRFTLGRHNREEYLNDRKREDPVEEARRMICAGVPDAIETVIGIARDPKAPDRARLMAVNLILDRTMGAPDRHGILEEPTREECVESLLKLFEICEEEDGTSGSSGNENTQTLEHPAGEGGDAACT